MSFSIIIPLYNKAKSIKKTILSVVNQSFTGVYEIIVVDDGSIDGSRRIVEQMQLSDLILIKQVNSGVSAARNNGAKAAKVGYPIVIGTFVISWKW